MLIVPNHSILLKNGTLIMESAEADLIRYVKASLGKAALAAFQEEHNVSSLHGRISENEIGLFKLNFMAHSKSTFQKLLNYCSAAITIPFPLLKERSAYIFCPGYCAAIACIWAIILRCPYGLYVRGTWLSADGNTPWIWAWVFRKASFIIATGEAFRQRLKIFNECVENEIPLTKIACVNEPSTEFRKRLRIRRILFVGRLTEQKGILDLIRAIEIARTARVPDLELVIVGGGTPEEEARVRAIAKECNVLGSVSILGHLDVTHLKQQYSMADIFVFPSYFREGFPRVLYEAMIYGLPIVTTTMPGIEGYLIDEKNCLLCKPQDPTDIAKCIARLSQNVELGAVLGRQAQSEVIELFKGFKHASHEAQLISLVNRAI